MNRYHLMLCTSVSPFTLFGINFEKKTFEYYIVLVTLVTGISENIQK